MADNIEPISHLEKVITGNAEPISHLEQIIALYGGTGGSGGSGTTNYNALLNKPSINGVDLVGNKTLTDLGITNYDDTQVKSDIADLQNNKVDKSQIHTHSNKTVLDKITQNSLDDWNDGVRKIVFVGSDAEGTNGWYKVAEQTCSGNGDTNITFMVTSTYSNYNVGILQLQIRSGDSNISCKTLKWLTRIGFDVNHYVVTINGMTWTLYAYQPNFQYGRIAFEILSMSSINDKNMTWVLNFADNSTKETTEPVATVTSSDVASNVPLTKIVFSDTTNYEVYNPNITAYEVVNGICYLQADVKVVNKYLSYNKVLDGIPRPKLQQNGMASPWNSNNNNANLLFEIRDGSLFLAYGEPSQHHLINIAYPVAE